MAELLVRTADKVNPDFYLNCQCTKRGDVIVAQPDGWTWGTAELSLPFYRILKCAALTLTEANGYLGPEIPIDPLNPSRTLQRRISKLNLDLASLPTAVKTYLADNARAVAFRTLTLTQVRAMKVVKPSIVDPGVIG